MSRYRNKDEPENGSCGKCQKAIWVRTGVYTVYHGQGNYYNDISMEEPCSYNTLDGSLCVDCFDEL